MTAKAAQAELDQALQKCRDEYVAPGQGRTAKENSACYLRPYLKARHNYHKLLVAAGMLDPESAEPDPDLRAAA